MAESTGVLILAGIGFGMMGYDYWQSRNRQPFPSAPSFRRDKPSPFDEPIPRHWYTFILQYSGPSNGSITSDPAFMSEDEADKYLTDWLLAAQEAGYQSTGSAYVFDDASGQWKYSFFRRVQLGQGF